MDKLKDDKYVSRAGLKMELANQKFRLSFKDKNVLDVGSSTGGFTDYALKKGARKIIAIELGTNQMDESIAKNPDVELHEKTNILDILPYQPVNNGSNLRFIPDITMIDLSFVSLKKILPHISKLINQKSLAIVLVKPQFEAKPVDKNKGIIKNEAIRRHILKDFEYWVKEYFIILDKVDSMITGTKGNKERFYLLSKKINSKLNKT
jgi:23S rRNA (cytidine1920-2'-O)/16S rRNA (cytidine1409-2'-O)-methyltransferase